MEARQTAASAGEGFYLRTKLLVPPRARHVIDRPRLLPAASGSGDLARLTLVVAPAGSGKTTLLSQWQQQLARQEHVTAWVTLDERDNNTYRFWLYLLRAVATELPQTARSPLRLLEENPPAPVEAVITAFLNAVVDLGSPLVILLDDYHLLERPPVHQSVCYLIERLPPQLHLIVASRSEPPLPLARWRARAQLRELREQDLRFTLGEAEAFLAGSGAGTALELYERTEGWAAGMYLAALLGSGQHPRQLPQGRGGAQAIRDYLFEEVFAQQPQDIQGFLLQTSIVADLNAPLCDALTDRHDSQSVLEALERQNLFLSPLGEGQWYRYHGLFSEMLRQQLRQKHPEWLASLHGRASRWYESCGMWDLAIDHALDSDEPARAYALIKREAPSALARGAFITLVDWLRKLPREQVQPDRDLRLLFVRALLHAGATEEARQWLDSVNGTVPDTPLDRADVLAARARLANFDGDLEQASLLAEEALSLLPESELTRRSDVAFDLGFAAYNRGDAATAERAFGEARTCGEAAGNFYGTLLAERYLGIQLMSLGKLHEARRLFEASLRGMPEGDRGGARGMPYVGLGVLFYEWNRLGESDHCLTEGLRYARQNGDVKTLAWGYVDLAFLRFQQGRLEDAATALEDAERVGMGAPVARTRALFALRQGNTREARQWAASQQLDTLTVDAANEQDLLAYARLLNAQGQRRQSLERLEGLEALARTDGRRGNLIRILVLKAATLFGERQLEQAVTVLHEAVTLAEPEGYVRTFADEGAPIAELLRRLGRRNFADERLRAYLTQLLSACGERTPVPHEPETQTLPSFEPLSDRELEVLGLIGQGLTNQEIAKELGVSLSTVKTHINNLYGKLLVRTRTQVLAKARSLGLLD